MSYDRRTRKARKILSGSTNLGASECTGSSVCDGPEAGQTSKVASGAHTNAPATRVREALLADYEGIARLQARYGLDARSFEEWSHLWLANPAYWQKNSWPLGWVLESERNQIVGYIGNIPLHYELQGQSLLATTGRAFVVDAPYRSHSLRLLDRYFRQPQIDLFLNTTVNSQALGAYRVFRASRAPIGTWDRSAFWITNYRGFVNSLLKSKSVPAASLLSFPLALVPYLQEQLRKKRLERNPDIQVQSCSIFDERFEAFWKELKRTNCKLLAVRDRATLNWHFKYSLQQGRCWVFTVGAKSRIDAYAIFLRDDNNKFSLKRIRLIDFQVLDNRYCLLLPMISEALRRCRAERVDMMEVIGYCPEKRKVVEPFIPYRRQLPSWMYFYKTNDRVLAEQLRQPEVWDPTGFDGDSSF